MFTVTHEVLLHEAAHKSRTRRDGGIDYELIPGSGRFPAG
jgi:hypothetical protein